MRIGLGIGVNEAGRYLGSVTFCVDVVAIGRYGKVGDDWVGLARWGRLGAEW